MRSFGPATGWNGPRGSLWTWPRFSATTHPVTLEIGFGNGDSLAEMAALAPGRNWLGVEVHGPGVGHLLLEIERRGLANLRIVRHDAVELLTFGIAPGALDACQLFFPDPWPKKRHHKRRILSPAFVELIARALRPGGVFHAATDWEPYAEQMLAVLEAPNSPFENLGRAGTILRAPRRPAPDPLRAARGASGTPGARPGLSPPLMALLRLVGVRPRVLAPVSLSVAAGELVFVSGPSGSGKSLLLRAIADLDPHEGEAWLGSESRSAMPAPRWRRRVGLLPAESFWWADSVGAHFPDSGAGLAAGLDRLLGDLGFEPEVLAWSVSRLSTGERQRLALARLLVQGPEALLLDEATANLDPGNRDRVELAVQGYRVARDAAVLWVSHDPEQRERLGGRQLAIRDGRLGPSS